MIEGLMINLSQVSEGDGTSFSKKTVHGKTSTEFSEILNQEVQEDSNIAKADKKDKAKLPLFTSDYSWETLSFLIVPEVEASPLTASVDVESLQDDPSLAVGDLFAAASNIHSEIDAENSIKVDIDLQSDMNVLSENNGLDEGMELTLESEAIKPAQSSWEETSSKEMVQDIPSEDIAIEMERDPDIIKTSLLHSPANVSFKAKEAKEFDFKSNTVELEKTEPFTPTKVEVSTMPFGEGVQEAIVNPPLVESTGETEYNPMVAKEPVEPMDILNQIASKVEFITRGEEQEIKIRLKPDFLGDVLIKVTTDQRCLRAEFYVDNVEVRHTLQTFVHDLQGQFLEKGLELTEINVYQMSDSWQLGSEHQGFSEEHPQGKASKNHYLRSNNIDEEEISLERNYGIWVQDSSVDYMI